MEDFIKIIAIFSICCILGYGLFKLCVNMSTPDYEEMQYLSGQVINTSSCGHIENFKDTNPDELLVVSGPVTHVYRPTNYKGHSHYYCTVFEINGERYTWDNSDMFWKCSFHEGEYFDGCFVFGYKNGKCVNEYPVYLDFNDINPFDE